MASLQRGKAVARPLLDKQLADERLLSPDARRHWYEVEAAALRRHAGPLAAAFVQSACDCDTDEFVAASKAASDSLCLQLYYSLAATLLGAVMTKTSVNGVLNRGGMFLLSAANLDRLFDGVEVERPVRTVIDLGAGDGAITDALAAYFTDRLRDGGTVTAVATEASLPMRYRLKQRGITVLADVDAEWRAAAADGGVKCDMLCALNLLDRHPRPLTLLDQLWRKATDDRALVLLAVVLPWSQFTEFSPAGPQERIALGHAGGSFEAQAAAFHTDVLAPAGFELLRWTKLPYLCEGDSVQAYYHLHDAVFLLRPVGRR